MKILWRRLTGADMGRKSLGKDHRNALLRRNRRIEALINSGQLTARQCKFLGAFVSSRSKTLAAIRARYKGPPHQAGYQAFPLPLPTPNDRCVIGGDVSASTDTHLWSRGVARWFRWSLAVADPFVCRCLNSSTMLPFPHPAHRTGRADLPHPALGEDSRNR